MEICSDCPPLDYPTDKTRCEECPRGAEEWKCAGCGVSGPDRFRRCECVTNVVVMQCADGRTFTEWKMDANQERAIQAAFDGCAECDRLKKHLREIGRWTADILNADRGEVDYQLREFAQDVYGEIHSALKENMPS